MSTSAKLNSTAIDASDLLDGARAIPTGSSSTCILNPAWIAPSKFLEWATRGFEEGDEYGLQNAITYSKRAACCRIDRLIHNFHLENLSAANFPGKIKALEAIGISIPSVIQKLIIDPRNELEHGYKPASEGAAKNSLDIAKLFLAATDSVDDQNSVVALNMNIQYSYTINASGHQVKFDGWSDRTMLFIDVFDEPHAAKLVDGKSKDVRYTELTKFTQKQAVELASMLQPQSSTSGYPEYFYREIKGLAGF